MTSVFVFQVTLWAQAVTLIKNSHPRYLPADSLIRKRMLPRWLLQHFRYLYLWIAPEAWLISLTQIRNGLSLMIFLVFRICGLDTLFSRQCAPIRQKNLRTEWGQCLPQQGLVTHSGPDSRSLPGFQPTGYSIFWEPVTPSSPLSPQPRRLKIFSYKQTNK